MWNFESPTTITLRTVLVGHEHGVYAVDLTDAIIVSGSGDNTIKVHYYSSNWMVQEYFIGK